MKEKIWRIDCLKISVTEVLNWCCANEPISHLLIVVKGDLVRSKWIPDKEAERKRKKYFDKNIVREFLASGWPGMKLIGGAALVAIFRFDERLKRRIIRLGPRFIDWYGPDRKQLPEDICLYASGRDLPVLVSVTHENDAWIISAKQPPFGERLSRSEQKEFLRFFYTGPFRCRRWTGKGRLYRDLIRPKS